MVESSLPHFIPGCDMSSPTKRFYLFGYPIGHSVAPIFHNSVFNSLECDNVYELYPTSEVTIDVLCALRDNSCGGCA